MYKTVNANIIKGVFCSNVEELKSMFEDFDFLAARYHGCTKDGVLCFTAFFKCDGIPFNTAVVEKVMYDGFHFHHYDEFEQYAIEFPENVNNIMEV